MIFLLGDRARFPLKLRPKGLVTAAIVVADIKGHKNAVKDHDSVFFYIYRLVIFLTPWIL